MEILEKRDGIKWTVEKIVERIDNGTINFDHPMQRDAEQWTKEQESLLIHSILGNYPVPSVYATVEIENSEKKFSVLDGLQRLTTVNSYVKDVFKLIEDFPKVVVNSTVFDISGLSFSEIPECLKTAFNKSELLICVLSNCSDEEAEMVLDRLNSGTPFSMNHKTINKLGSKLCRFVDKISASDFFKNKTSFTDSQVKKSERQTCILQTILLLTEDYKYKTFNNGDLAKFAKFFQHNHTEQDLKEILDLFNLLNDIYKERHKLIKKINIPIFARIIKTGLEQKIPVNIISEWANDFISKYTPECEYHLYCGDNSTSKKKISTRIELAQKSLTDFVARKGAQL